MVHRVENLEKYRGMRAGREIEIDYLGTVEIRDPKFREELFKVVKDPEHPYVSYRQALELAKKFQPGDPTNPKKDFLRELRLALADKLGLETDEELDRIGAYTAVDTPLDIFHGVDGFIEFNDPKTGEEVITFDLTIGEERLKEKLETGKADVIISELPDPKVNESGYLKKVLEIAQEMADKIRKKQRPH